MDFSLYFSMQRTFPHKTCFEHMLITLPSIILCGVRIPTPHPIIRYELSLNCIGIINSHCISAFCDDRGTTAVHYVQFWAKKAIRYTPYCLMRMVC